MNWGMDDSVPIKVVHENARRSNAGSDDTTDSETSSQGSGQNIKTQKSYEPKVHHIPIMVEPRDGSTSSGYGSDGIGDDFAHRPSRCNSARNSTDSEVKSGLGSQAKSTFASGKYQSPSQHFNSEPSSSDNQGSNSNIRHIPIVLEKQPASNTNVFAKKSRTHPNVSRSSSGPTPQDRFQESQPTVVRSASGPNASKQRESSPVSNGINKPASQKPANGPYVTKISVNKDTAQPQNQQPSHPKIQPIANIQKEVQDLRGRVENFTCSSAEDKNYRYLDEMLTRCLLKLDNIDTEGIEEVRQARKAAIKDVQLTLSILESKIKTQVPEAMHVDDSREGTPGPMEVTESNEDQPMNSQQSSDNLETQMDSSNEQKPVNEIKNSSESPEQLVTSQESTTAGSQEMPFSVPETIQEETSEVPESKGSEGMADNSQSQGNTLETSEMESKAKSDAVTVQVTSGSPSQPPSAKSTQCNNEQTKL